MKVKGKQKKPKVKDYRLSITVPWEIHEHLASLSENSLCLRSIASYVREALLEKYGKKLT